MYNNSVKKSTMDDIDVLECARYFSYLEPMPPITAELDKWRSKYPSQKVHMVKWLEWQTHTHNGAYGRDVANHSTQTMYNRFQNPGGLLWMAEVLGEEEQVLRQAVHAAVEAEKTAAKSDAKSRCAAFRRVIPWKRIAELLSDWDGWRFDPKMEPLIVVDSRTEYPTIRDGKKRKYLEIMAEESGEIEEPMDLSPEAKEKFRKLMEAMGIG